MAYIDSFKGQNWLLPPSIRDMIPGDHVCFFVEDFVDSLDYSGFDLAYGGAGHPAYHPRVLLKVLVYGMMCGTRSSRKIARAARENFVFMYLAERLCPDFRTVARFRKDNSSFIKGVFRKTVEVSVEYDLADLSFVSVDGSMLKACAGKKKYFGREGIDKLEKAIDKMIEEDIALDELEDELFDDREEGLTGVDRRDLKRIVREYRESEDKKKVEEKVKKAKTELVEHGLKKVSISDPECRMMQNKHGVSELCYNVQLGVSNNQIVLSSDVCRDKHDAHQFIPQVKNLRENVGLLEETKIGVDCAYSDGENIRFAEDEGLDLYVPSRAQAQEFDFKEQNLNHDHYEYDEERNEIVVDGIRYRYRGPYTRNKSGRRLVTFYNPQIKKKKDLPFYFKERLRMRDKMSTPEGRRIYNMRKTSVEPVYGNLKANLGFREFLLRGMEKVKIEVNLACIAHNLFKIHRMMREKNAVMA
jgi:transposase